jgi:hypothetical protein
MRAPSRVGQGSRLATTPPTADATEAAGRVIIQVSFVAIASPAQSPAHSAARVDGFCAYRPAATRNASEKHANAISWM